jgi:hypothetical protein
VHDFGLDRTGYSSFLEFVPEPTKSILNNAADLKTQEAIDMIIQGMRRNGLCRIGQDWFHCDAFKPHNACHADGLI